MPTCRKLNERCTDIVICIHKLKYRTYSWQDLKCRVKFNERIKIYFPLMYRSAVLHVGPLWPSILCRHAHVGKGSFIVSTSVKNGCEVGCGYCDLCVVWWVRGTRFAVDLLYGFWATWLARSLWPNWIV